MSAFTGPLQVEFGEDGRTATLLSPLVWEVDELGSGRIVWVPEGFTSDGASVPRAFWAVVPPHGHRGVRAAFLHDYGIDRIKRGDPHPHMPTRLAADRQYYLALLACGVGPTMARTMFLSVRARSLGLV
jgi:hypothetical protein